MSNVFVGSSGMQEQPIKRGWEAKRGFFTTRSWRGQQADAEALRDSLIAGGEYASVDLNEGPTWEVVAQADSDVEDGNTQPDNSKVDTWELTGNRVEKDLLASGVGTIIAMAESDKKKLRAFERGDKNWDTDEWDGTASGTAEAVYKLMRSGVKSSIVLQPVLKRNATVSSKYTVPNSLANAGTVRKTSTLLAEESIPASIANNMPASSSDTVDGLTFWSGWLKGYPTVTDTIDGKVSVQQEWEWGWWPTTLYSVA